MHNLEIYKRSRVIRVIQKNDKNILIQNVFHSTEDFVDYTI